MKSFPSVILLLLLQIVTNSGCGCKNQGVSSIPPEKSLAKKENRDNNSIWRIHTGYYGSSVVPNGWTMSTGNDLVIDADRLNNEDYQGIEEEYQKVKVTIYQLKAHKRYEFDGGQPLSYEAGIQYQTTDIKPVLFNRFRGWTCDFKYSKEYSTFGGIAETATAVNDNGKIVAEAKVLKLIKDEETGMLAGIEIQETHFDYNGKASFKCLSQFEKLPMFKKVELCLEGKKKVEYFPIWSQGD